MQTLTIYTSVVFLLSFIISFFSKDINTTTSSLKKPSYYPPSYAFGLIWPVLFILYAYVLYSFGDNKKMLIFGLIVLLFTLLWTPIFTISGSVSLGFYYILFVLLLNISFLFVSRKWLLLPQVLWLSFATFLSYKLYILNKN